MEDKFKKIDVCRHLLPPPGAEAVGECIEKIKSQSKFIEDALEIVYKYGSIDGEHHKTWVIDQVVRKLTGDKYEEWVKNAKAGEEMSTKIYNVYRIKELTVEEIFLKLVQIKEHYKKHCLDLLWVMYDKETPPKLEGITNQLAEFSKQNLNHPLNLAASAAIYLHKGEKFLQFFGLPEEIQDKVMFEYFGPLAEDFHYQDQADGPENISQKDWEERGRLWDEILSHGVAFSDNGFSYDFVGQKDLFRLAFDHCQKAYKYLKDKGESDMERERLGRKKKEIK